MKKILQIAAGNVVVFLTLLLVFELTSGFGVYDTRIRQVGVMKSVHLRYPIGDLYKSVYPNIEYIRDENGFRGKYSSPDSIDILTVGGSTTDQRYITEGRTWQDVISRELSSDTDKFYVVNAGIDGQSSFGHIKNFTNWFPYVKNLKPKYLLFYVGINDVFRFEENNYDIISSESPPDSFLKRMEAHSIIMMLYAQISGMVQARLQETGHARVNFHEFSWTSTGLIPNHQEYSKSQILAFKLRLKELTKLAGAMSARPIFVTQRFFVYRRNPLTGLTEGISKPLNKIHGIDVNGVDFAKFMALYNEATLDECKAASGICIDLANDLNFAPEDYYDYGHTTETGSQKIGSYIAASLKMKLQH